MTFKIVVLILVAVGDPFLVWVKKDSKEALVFQGVTLVKIPSLIVKLLFWGGILPDMTCIVIDSENTLIGNTAPIVAVVVKGSRGG